MRKQVKQQGADFIPVLYPTILQRILYRWPKRPLYIKTAFFQGKSFWEVLTWNEEESVVVHSEKQAMALAKEAEVYIEKRMVKNAG